MRSSALSLFTTLLITTEIFSSASPVTSNKPIWSPWSTPPSVPSSLPLLNTIIYDFGLGVWAENLNTRPNGEILVTIWNRPEVWLVNPFQQQNGTLLHKFEGKTSCLGIVETSPDIFYVIVGNSSFSPMLGGTLGSWSIWELDFASLHGDSALLVSVTHVLDIPDATFLNGMEVINPELGIIAVGDTTAGLIYTINVKHKARITTIKSNLFNSTASFPAGVNGLKMLGSDLYFTNLARSWFGMIPMNTITGEAKGPAQRLPLQFPYGGGDDFTFDKFGNAYISVPGSHQGIYYVPAPVSQATNATLLSSLTGPTACKFGSTRWDKGSLYVTTAGNESAYSVQNYTISSTLSRIDIYT